MRYIDAISLPLQLAFRYGSKRHQLGYELVIQSRPAQGLCKWKGRVCQMGLFPYHCLEVSLSNMQLRCITRRGKSFWSPTCRKQRCACFIKALSIRNIIYSVDELLGERHCQVIQVTISQVSQQHVVFCERLPRCFLAMASKV